MIVAGYCRVSTTEQAEHGYSIREQEERIRAYCTAKGWTLYRVYSDPGFSGASLARPGLQTMMDDIKSGDIDAVLVYKLDRLSRSQKDALYLIEDVFLTANVGFISISENFDTSSPLGRAMVGILAVFAQLEREQIKERMILGKTARAKNGKWQGGKNAPVGYLFDKEKGLKIFEDEAIYIRQIFYSFADGVTIAEIERQLKEAGARNRYGLFTRININRILGNPVYVGKLIYKGEVYDAIHDPIIPDRIFEKAQEIRNWNHSQWEQKIRGSKNPSLLSGLLFCGICGGRYHHIKWSPNGIPRYVCYSRDKRLLNMIKDPACKNKTWKESELDALILEEIKKLSFDPDALREILKPKEKKEKDKAPDYRAQLARLKKQRSKYMDLYAVGGMELDAVREKLEPLNQQISDMEKKAIDQDGESRPETAALIPLFKNAGEIIEAGDKAEKRRLIRSLIKKIVLTGEDVEIHWNYI